MIDEISRCGAAYLEVVSVRRKPVARIHTASLEGPRDWPGWIWKASVTWPEGRVGQHVRAVRGVHDIVRVGHGEGHVLGGPLRIEGHDGQETREDRLREHE